MITRFAYIAPERMYRPRGLTLVFGSAFTALLFVDEDPASGCALTSCFLIYDQRRVVKRTRDHSTKRCAPAPGGVGLLVSRVCSIDQFTRVVDLSFDGPDGRRKGRWRGRRSSAASDSGSTCKEGLAVLSHYHIV